MEVKVLFKGGQIKNWVGVGGGSHDDVYDDALGGKNLKITQSSALMETLSTILNTRKVTLTFWLRRVDFSKAKVIHEQDFKNSHRTFRSVD